jgi:hypothetical protein
LGKSTDGASQSAVPVSERLDAFYEKVVKEWRKGRPKRVKEGS